MATLPLNIRPSRCIIKGFLSKSEISQRSYSGRLNLTVLFQNSNHCLYSQINKENKLNNKYFFKRSRGSSVVGSVSALFCNQRYPSNIDGGSVMSQKFYQPERCNGQLKTIMTKYRRLEK